MIRELFSRRQWIQPYATTDIVDGLLAALVAGETVNLPVTLLVGHPDDELIGMGSRLGQLKNLTLVHATDGAPSDMRYARALGFPSAKAYSSARFGELHAALAIAGARPAREITLGFPDGETVHHLSSLVEHVREIISGTEAVITHAYEGGHPDHDSCALAVQLACSQDSIRHRPVRLEFAGYHSHRGRLITNLFWPLPNVPDKVVKLTWQERRIKRKAMRAFATQSIIVKKYPPGREVYRRAPVYDFSRPPPPGEWYYDNYDWSFKGEEWLALVRAKGLMSMSPAGDNVV
jgi:LmbE family N-acetylglucosaminyl deacetylase